MGRNTRVAVTLAVGLLLGVTGVLLYWWPSLISGQITRVLRDGHTGLDQCDDLIDRWPHREVHPGPVGEVRGERRAYSTRAMAGEA